MENLIEKVSQIIARGEGAQLTEADVAEIIRRHPWFTLPAAEWLRAHPDEAQSEQGRRYALDVAINSPNPTALYMLLDPEGMADAGFYPEKKVERPSTVNAIDSFLATYGSTSPQEEQALERLIFNPTPDYAQVLAREEEESVPDVSEAPAGTQDDLINRFIINSKKEEEASAASPLEPAAVESRIDPQAAPHPSSDDSLLSESLARIFIRQKQYERAFEIISQLNLNYPEKSVYFADQLRFLQKLIAYRQKSTAKQQH